MSRVREVPRGIPSVPPGVLNGHDHDRSAEDAARVSACLKACEGIPTSLLEEGFVTRLVVACLHVDDPRVQDILNDLVQARTRRQRSRGGEV